MRNPALFEYDGDGVRVAGDGAWTKGEQQRSRKHAGGGRGDKQDEDVSGESHVIENRELRTRNSQESTIPPAICHVPVHKLKI